MFEQLTIIAMAAAPIVELRGAIPLGIGVYGLSPMEVAVLAYIGNLVPIFLVYFATDRWIRFTDRRKGFLERITTQTLERSKRVFSGKRAVHGLWALPLFVALPLPMTGAWTGAIAAYLFGIPFKKAFPLIALGLIVATAIVTLATTGAVSALDFVVTDTGI